MKKSTKTGLGIVAAAALATTGAIVAFAIGSSDDSKRVDLGCNGTFDLGNYVTFNSITDPTCNILKGEHGEKAFIGVAAPGSTTLDDNVVAKDGETYTIAMYVHNNAVSDTDDDRKVDEGRENTIAKNTTVQINMQRREYNGVKNSFYILGSISADNATPKTVTDHTVLYSENGEEFELSYSNARYLSGNGETYPIADANKLFGDGQLVGYNGLDGNLPGCSKFSGWVYVDVTATYKKPSLEITKAVKNLNHENEKFADKTTAKSGDKLEYRIVATNNGDAMTKVNLLDSFGEGADKYVKYEKGSAVIHWQECDANHQNCQKKEQGISDLFTTQVTELLDLNAKSNFYITYNATVADGVDQLCQKTTIENTITAFNKNGNSWTKTSEDNAIVQIDGKECHEGHRIDKFAQLATDNIDDESTWHDDGSLRAKRGENVRFRIRFYNTGDTDLPEVKLRDPLAGTGFVLDNSKTPYFVRKSSNGAISKTEVKDIENIALGTVAQHETIYFYLEAYVPANTTKETLVCEDKQLTNYAYGSYKNSDKETVTDEVVIITADDCSEDEKNPDHKIEKYVQIKGGNEFKTSITAKAGDTVRYQIKFKNTGDTTIEKYVLKDKLNDNLTYVKNSTTVLRNGNEVKKSDGITEGGIEIGDYAPGEEAIIYFYATVKTVLPNKCEDTNIPNVATGYYNNDQSTRKNTNEATVTVNKVVCDTPETPNTPPEMPKTGAASMLGLVLSIAGASTAAAYYINSRKK